MDLSEKAKRMKVAGCGKAGQKAGQGSTPPCWSYYKVDNAGGGDCLFHSVAQSIQHVDNKACHHRQVRAAAVAHLKRHASKYAFFWDHRNPDSTLVSIKDLQEDFLNYLSLVGKVGSWSGNLELAALASTLDRPIYVIHEMGQIYGFNLDGSEKDLLIWYSRSSRTLRISASAERSCAHAED